MSFGQFASTTQFYLYGKKYCTKTGWKAASEKYASPDILRSEGLSLEGRVYFLTGANSGIGFEIATFLGCHMATVYMICRNPERAHRAQQEIISKSNNPNIFVIICDCALQTGVRSAWNEFIEHQTALSGSPRLDGLLCNAGALSDKKTTTSEGIETTLAAHLLFGTYLLTTLAIPVLEATPGSRVVVVSSGGMYNTKMPTWDIAANLTGKYDGQFAYAYAKRAQVLLCEQWTDMYPSIKFVSCHPGWVDTPGVQAAYGDKKQYLEPLRSLWEGSEGIIWLLLADKDQLQGGGFYLDRQPRVKHLAGPFFTEGTFTKNSPQEIADMMATLQLWGGMRSTPGIGWDPSGRIEYISGGKVVTHEPSGAPPCTMTGPLLAMTRPIDIQRFMGRWYVQANIPTFVDKGTVNNIEDYIWDEARNLILVSFKYRCHAGGGGAEGVPGGGEGSVSVGRQREVRQHGTILNDAKTEWSLSVKFIIYWPIPTRYLIIGLDELNGTEGTYATCMIGVPDRSCVWIMSRSSAPLSDADLGVYVERAAALGYDTSQISRVPFIPVLEDGDSSATSIAAMADRMTSEERLAMVEEIFSTLNDKEKTQCLDRLRSSMTD